MKGLRRLAVVVAVAVALAQTAAATVAAAPKAPSCCAYYSGVEIRPPRYWNGRRIGGAVPAGCRLACGRR